MDILQSILSHWYNVLAVLLVLGGLIFFHELGHFTMARILGIGVRTFSLGFGPKLLTIHRGKTDYSLSLIPLGGYVSLAGEEDDSNEQDTEQQSHHTETDLFSPDEKFSQRPAWNRLLVVLAGPIANIILAFFIYWGVLWFQGNTFLIPKIGTITNDSPAEQSGLMPGDVITQVNGKPIYKWEQLADYIAESQGHEMTLIISRDDQLLEFHLKPGLKLHTNLFGEEKPTWLIGVLASGEIRTTPLNMLSAAIAGIHKTQAAIMFTVESLLKLFQKVVPLDNIGGPILIAQMVGQQASAGVLPVLLLAALISINLGILNLLPIPILDGGHIVFLVIEMVFHRPISIFVKTISMRVGITLLLGLMLFATWNDIMRLLS